MGARPIEGLAGLDLVGRFVAEVDGPGALVRLYPRDGFTPDAGAARIAIRRTRHEVIAPGAVEGVGAGSFVVDTGASVEAVVTAMGLLRAHRRRGSADALLGPLRDEASSPDYWTEVPGLALGPFRFPATPVVGRDRERERVGGGTLGLVGMGLLRHLRVAFDLRHASLWAVPGPSYRALLRAGLEVEDTPEGDVLVTRVVPNGSAAVAGLRLEDQLLAGDGRPVRGGAAGVRVALADEHVAARRLRLRRGGAVVAGVTLGLP